MGVKAIIFDKDGTLLDFDSLWVPVAVSAVTELLYKLNIYEVSAEELLKTIGIVDGVTNIEGVFAKDPYPVIGRVLHEKLEEYGYSFSFEKIIESLVECFHNNLDKGIILPSCDNIEFVLSELKEKGIMLLIATSDDLETTLSCLEHLNIRDFFDKIYTIDDGLPPKPMPDTIEDICNKYGFKKNELIMVGDTLTDMRFAKNGGIRSVGIAKCSCNADILKLEADHVIGELSQLLEIVDL